MLFRSENPTQPTYDAETGYRTQATFVLSPLHQACSLFLPVEIKTVWCKSVYMDDTLSVTESEQTAKDNSQDEFNKVEVETIEQSK